MNLSAFLSLKRPRPCLFLANVEPDSAIVTKITRVKVSDTERQVKSLNIIAPFFDIEELGAFKTSGWREGNQPSL